MPYTFYNIMCALNTFHWTRLVISVEAVPRKREKYGAIGVIPAAHSIITHNKPAVTHISPLGAVSSSDSSGQTPGGTDSNELARHTISVEAVKWT